MFGQEPQLPVDFLLGRVQEPEGGRTSDWIQEHQRRLEVAFYGARERLHAAALRRKERHDQKGQSDPLEVGQLVYIKDHSVRGRNKIQDAWSPTVHQVLRAPSPGGVVYSVAPVHDLNRSHQVHRTMLKPAGRSNCPEPPSVPPEPQRAAVGDTEDDDVGQWILVRSPGIWTWSAGLDPAGFPPSTSGPVSPQVQVEPPTHASAQLAPTETGPETGASALRRTLRSTAGRHGNPHHLPVSVVSRTDGATNSRVLGSSSMATAAFRPWC